MLCFDLHLSHPFLSLHLVNVSQRHVYKSSVLFHLIITSFKYQLFVLYTSLIKQDTFGL